MLSLLSPTFRVDAGHAPVDPLELLELELPVLVLELVDVAPLVLELVDVALLVLELVDELALLPPEPPTVEVPPPPVVCAVPSAPHPGRARKATPRRRRERREDRAKGARFMGDDSRLGLHPLSSRYARVGHLAYSNFPSAMALRRRLLAKARSTRPGAGRRREPERRGGAGKLGRRRGHASRAITCSP
jgi:hypothetical protein